LKKVGEDMFTPVEPPNPQNENFPGGEMSVFDEKDRPANVVAIRYIPVKTTSTSDKKYKVTIKAFICEHPGKSMPLRYSISSYI
jgi:hypothetical protein